MRHFRHDAIVVTGGDDIRGLHEAAKGIFADTAVIVSEITRMAINSTCSFLIAPDGSKEGWRESNKGNETRARFIKLLQDDGGAEWVWVKFGGDKPEDISAAGSLDDGLRRIEPLKDED